MNTFQENQLLSGGDTMLHYHLQDRTPTHDTLDGLQAIQSEVAVSANYTASYNDDILVCDATSGNITLTLPLAKGGKQFIIVKTNATNNVVITAGGSNTINGLSTLTLSTQWATVTLKASTNRWLVIANA
jgi:hypothetical protein